MATKQSNPLHRPALLKSGSDVTRRIILFLIPFLLLPATAPAQRKKATDADGLYPPIVEDKKKKTETTQTLPPAREL
ncbi:MAG: hypothetical protein ABSH09_07505, partial [Bryobacteraceae bacterium]